jgi:uracil-DNA glycosylase
VSGAYRAALAAFLAAPLARDWHDLSVFRDGTADHICALVDREAADGEVIAPEPARVFAALAATQLGNVRAVILGQDPYPTPGHANGLAFSCDGPVPRSLANIYRELSDDLDVAAPRDGRLDHWAAQGVLLLNTALTVRAGSAQAGSHLKLGWQAVTDGVIAAVSERANPSVFILWGNPAQAKRGMIDETRHLLLASAHPSPLSVRRGFFGSKPFSRANHWLEAHGREAINWASGNMEQAR